jgi:hypothetical protein
MSVKPGFYQKNEIISGLSSHKYIKSIYGTNSLVNEKCILL